MPEHLKILLRTSCALDTVLWAGIQSSYIILLSRTQCSEQTIPITPWVSIHVLFCFFFYLESPSSTSFQISSLHTECFYFSLRTQFKGYLCDNLFGPLTTTCSLCWGPIGIQTLPSWPCSLTCLLTQTEFLKGRNLDFSISLYFFFSFP